MNLVFVNHAHPATPHVAGMRSWFFARELANRGHRVVQICEGRDGRDAAPPPADLAPLLGRHDWAEPLLLAVRSVPHPLLMRIRSPRTNPWLRKALVAWQYGRHAGLFTDFSDAAQPYLPELSAEFRPTLTWAPFGNTDCWLIAQRISRLAGCPWVADMKDPWDVFIPRPLRSVLAQRFCDMAASTANSEFNARVLRTRFGAAADVIYSGVDPSFVAAAPATLPSGCVRITLTGSIHYPAMLHRFVEGLKGWLSLAHPGGRVPDRKSVEIIYAGADADTAASAFRALHGLATVQINRYLPLTQLAAICRSATVNAYIWNPNTFHHKLLELLSCGRPVIAFPGESDESHRLARGCAGELHGCANAAELSAALDDVVQRAGTTAPAKPRTGDFTWAMQAARLESALQRASAR